MSSVQKPELAEVINRAVQLALARMFKVRVGRIEKFDASTGLADVKPLQHEVREEDGTTSTYSVAVIPNVPVVSLGGGDFHLTMPVQQNDECVLLCADRSIDLWFDKGGEGDPLDLRRHNPTDAIAIVGLRSKPRKLSEWPTDRVELGKQGSVKVAVKDGSVHLGVTSGQDATELAAFASNTKSELNKIRTALNTFVQTFNTHTHTVSTAGPPLAHTGTAAPTLSTATQCDPIGEVKCEKVYIK